MSMMITQLVLVTSIIGLLMYSFIMNVNKTHNDTISDIICKFIAERPIFLFFAGVLVGHLWFN